MAKILGTVEDLEDYKQKIEKQTKLKRRTINAVKKYLPKEEIKYLETKIVEENSASVQKEFKPCSKNVQTLFKNNAEKYEFLIKNDPQNEWIQEFKKTKEYELLYE